MADRDQNKQAADFQKVLDFLKKIQNFEFRALACVRGAVNVVLRQEATGRYSISQLNPQEKAHIGTQVETALIREFFDGRRGIVLDTTIDEIEVDIKNTVRDNWMIPHEAVGELCLLVMITEEEQSFSVGVVRANSDILTKPNQDGKCSLSAEGKQEIQWLLSKSHLPVSIFLTVSEDVRSKIRSAPSGQARVSELFRLVQNKPILRSDVATVANQSDPAKRIRDAKKRLKQEGILVLGGRYDRLEAENRGYKLALDEWISLRE